MDLLPPYKMDLLIMMKIPAPTTFPSPNRIKSVSDREPRFFGSFLSVSSVFSSVIVLLVIKQ